MDDSILKSVRTGCNLNSTCDAFDDQIIPFINTAFANLTQVGVGPSEGFAINGIREKWDDFTSDLVSQSWVKTYVSTFTRLMHDPPASSFVEQSLTKKLEECLWRLNVHCDPPEED